MNASLFRLQNATKYYDREQALNIDHLEIKNKTTTVIMGPNGAGKTTLLRILSLIEDLTSGHLCLEERDMTATLHTERGLKWRRRMATIWQNPYLFQSTTFNNIAMGLKFRELAGDQIKKKVMNISTALGIEDLLSLPAPKLSGGEKQRVSIARALITEPEILFVDEILLSLDTEGKELVMELLYQEKNKETTIILITHDLQPAKRLGDRFLVLEKGRLVADENSLHKLDSGKGMNLQYGISQT